MTKYYKYCNYILFLYNKYILLNIYTSSLCRSSWVALVSVISGRVNKCLESISPNTYSLMLYNGILFFSLLFLPSFSLSRSEALCHGLQLFVMTGESVFSLLCKEYHGFTSATVDVYI